MREAVIGLEYAAEDPVRFVHRKARTMQLHRVCLVIGTSGLVTPGRNGRTLARTSPESAEVVRFIGLGPMYRTIIRGPVVTECG